MGRTWTCRRLLSYSAAVLSKLVRDRPPPTVTPALTRDPASSRDARDDQVERRIASGSAASGGAQTRQCRDRRAINGLAGSSGSFSAETRATSAALYQTRQLRPKRSVNTMTWLQPTHTRNDTHASKSDLPVDHPRPMPPLLTPRLPWPLPAPGAPASSPRRNGHIRPPPAPGRAASADSSDAP